MRMLYKSASLRMAADLSGRVQVPGEAAASLRDAESGRAIFRGSTTRSDRWRVTGSVQRLVFSFIF